LEVHSARGILKFLPAQHLQPARWPEIADNRLARVASLRATAALRVDIAGKHNAARGESAPQLGQATGCSYSAIGRKSENEPQLGQSYSYIGIVHIPTDGSIIRDGDRFT
jgi:hypothetical protein